MGSKGEESKVQGQANVGHANVVVPDKSLQPYELHGFTKEDTEQLTSILGNLEKLLGACSLVYTCES